MISSSIQNFLDAFKQRKQSVGVYKHSYPPVIAEFDVAMQFGQHFYIGTAQKLNAEFGCGAFEIVVVFYQQQGYIFQL